MHSIHTAASSRIPEQSVYEQAWAGKSVTWKRKRRINGDKGVHMVRRGSDVRGVVRFIIAACSRGSTKGVIVKREREGGYWACGRQGRLGGTAR